MKKVFSGLLALAMAVSITGCNSGGALLDAWRDVEFLGWFFVVL